MRFRRPFTYGVTVGLLIAAQSATALSLYATIGTGQLWLIDPVNGHQLIGQPVTEVIQGLAGDSAGNLFGSTFTPWNTGSSLIRIDPQDGSLLSSIPIVGPGGAPLFVMDLAMQPGTDVLYAVTAIADPGIETQPVYTIDTTTGVATLLGRTGTQNTGEGSLAFASDGTLYFSDYRLFLEDLLIWRLDPATGQQLGSSIYSPGTAGMAGGPDGLLYGSPRGGGGTIAAIHRADLSVPSVSLWTVIVGAGEVGDLTFLPEPSTSALLAAGALALFALRRRATSRGPSRPA